MTNLYIYGTGEHACKVIRYAEMLNLKIVGLVDEKINSDFRIKNIPIVLKDDIISGGNFRKIFVAVGNPTVRSRITAEFVSNNWDIVSLIHPMSYVAKDVIHGKGVLISAGAIVETNVKLGDGVIVDIGALVDHDACISDYVHVKPGEVVKSRETKG
ncbi:hypothetical protein [Bdellovibrio sp. HCB-162]|uniref:PglD-related sugar-binding protein n=1 Tax=Bdellovibrio sp. HCB-162 TaxID=3394234 RepID=UPI0039BD281B